MPDATARASAPSSLCVLPWIHLHGSVDGVWGRCCVDLSVHHDHVYAQADKPDLRLTADALGCLPRSRFAAANPDRALSLIEAFNSPQLRQTRLAMLAGERPVACAYCYRREDAGVESYRQSSNRRFADLPDFERRLADTAPDGTVDAVPVFLDIRLGNACNLRCVMCGFPTSSRWGTDRRPSWSSAVIDPYLDDEEFWDIIRDNATRLRRMYFAGGEPFLQSGHLRMLDLLIETGAAGSIDVVYNSNLTVLPPGLFGRLDQFRSVGIGASCDGVGDVFERIRTGARWAVGCVRA